MKYQEIDYAYSRLDKTFILHNNSLNMVYEWDGSPKLTLRKKDGKTTKVTIEELDLTPAPLGYVNFSDTCCFTTRMPMRRDWKQGLRPNNLRRINYREDDLEERFEVRNLHDIYTLEDTVLNNYPSYRKCVDNVEETHRASAFSRCFAINELGKVIYKSQLRVGYVEDEKSIKLIQDYNYLKELLQESLIHPSNPEHIVEIRS